MLKGIIFDFDGVITYSIGTGKKVLNEILEEKNIEIDINKFSNFAFSGMNLRDRLKCVIPKRAIEVHDAWLIRFEKPYLEQVRLVEGADELIKNLYAMDLKLFILSTKHDRFIKSGLEKFDLEKYFEFIVGYEQPVKPKPNPEGVELILNKFNLEKSEIIYVGDSQTDVDLAKNANLRLILFENGEESAKKDFYWKRVAKLSEIENIVKEGK
jgi:HAD superfamily hydrolase (TIGR01549 family)